MGLLSPFDNLQGSSFCKFPQDEEEEAAFASAAQFIGQRSRYKQDFEELQKIGEGGAGRVFKARHKIDRNIYAIKKVRLYREDEEENERIKREVTVLSRLHNQHIVRYFQAWVEFVDDAREIEALAFSDEDDIAECTDEESSLSHLKSFNSDACSDDSDDFAAEEEDERYYVSDDDSLYSDRDFFQSKGRKKGKRERRDKKHFKKTDYDKSKLRRIKELGRKAAQNARSGIQILYIQMEFCEGNTLRSFIADHPGRQAENQKWRIFCQVVDALHYLHGLGLIHRDLKPSNIFLDKNNDVKLGDFGLATQQHHHGALASKPTQRQQSQLARCEQRTRSAQGLQPAHSVGIGTPAYMAPEQQRGKGKYNFLADMYSLGLILFEMWAGF